MKIKCIKPLHNPIFNFDEGETYQGNKINDNWYCIEAVGISKEEFDEHFIDEHEALKTVGE